MNCKQGDLAIYVGKNCPEAVGQIVRIVAPRHALFGPAWHISPPLRGECITPADPWSCYDVALRPIRGSAEVIAQSVQAQMLEPA